MGGCDFGNFAEVSPPVGVLTLVFAFRAMIPSRLLANMIRSMSAMFRRQDVNA